MNTGNIPVAGILDKKFGIFPSVPHTAMYVPLLNKSLVLEPGNYQYIAFLVKYDQDVSRVWGDFITEGEGDSNPEIMLFTEEKFKGWKEGRGGKDCLYYTSRTAPGAHLNMELSEGLYYLVFSNKESISGNGRVMINLTGVSVPLGYN